MADFPTHRDPETKDDWCYLAGPIAIREMILEKVVPIGAQSEKFHALGEQALLLLRGKGMLNKLIKSGDIAMLRMEKTDA